MMALNDSVLRIELERYSNLTHSDSVMAWAMFAINWLELGDLQQAEDAFKNSYLSLVKEPFKVWQSSLSDVGHTNSLVAMSSFLQALIFGYGGVRLKTDHLEVNPKLPSNLTGMKMKDLDYLGNSIDIEIMEETVRVMIRRMSAKQLYISRDIGQKLEIVAKLEEGVEIILSRTRFYIFTSNVTECPVSMGTSYVPMVMRSEWGAMSPRSPVSVVNPAERVIVYQTAGSRCTDKSACIKEVNSLQMKDMKDGKLSDVAYNFLVGEDGRVYEGRGWETLAHFPTGSAIDNLAIGVMGDFMCEFPSDLAMVALRQLIKNGVERGYIHWNYTLLGGRQLDNIHNLITTEDRLLCQLSKSVHWEPYQYGGMFVKPKCDRKCERPFQTPESRFHDISEKATLFETDKLPTLMDSDEVDFNYMASVGNGHLSTVVYSPTVYVNGLYNGPTGWSHRARIPALNAIRVNFTDTPENHVKRKFALDVERAVFEEKILSPKIHVLQRTYAHQFYTRLLITEIHVQRRPGVRGDVTFDLDLNIGGASKDITFNAFENVTNDQIKECDCVYHHGRTNEAEINGTALQDIHLYWNKRPESVTLPADLETYVWIYLTAMDQNRGVAEESMKAGLHRLREGDQVLFEKHVQAWKLRWDRGRIEVDGDVYLSKRIYGSFYYLLSFLPASDPYITPNQFYGLSPGGLANGANWTDYQGHVFWDMETWMYPTMLMFHPELAKEMLSYRIHGMKYAEMRAKEGNYSGLRFPWESAFTGYEQTPDICVPCRENQLHITGDIALAARQYLTLTRDFQWLKREKGYEFIRGMADFWRSRPTWNATKQAYDVNGVMPPDEHAQSINNSVYTNVGAKLSVHFARYAACLLGMNATEEVPDDWLEVADKLYLPFNSKGQYHPEFEGFEQWTDERGIKQADAILLGYPQMWPMSPEVRRNDLEMYEKITNPLGPAMTWGMYAIGWLELGDEARARELFWRSYKLYVREPFKIWTEVKTGLGAVNFITGMGGFLQTVFFGYGGARIHVEHLSFDPRVPPGNTALRFVGVDYLENSFDMEITHDRVRILPTKTSPDYPLVLRMTMSRAEYKFIKDKELLLPRKAFTLRTSVVTDCPVPEGSSCPLVIERSSWDTDPPTWSALARSHPAKYVILHHTTMARCFNYGDCKQQARLTEMYHKASIPQGLGLSDVGYSFLVGEDGSVFEGRGWDASLPDILGDKKNSIGIGALGDFSCGEPSEKFLEAIQRLIKCGVERKKIHPHYRVIGFDQIHHNDVPADRLLCEIQSWPQWHNFDTGKMMAGLDCDSPCDPTAPRTLEGDVKDESPHPTVFMTHKLPMKKGSEEVDFRYMASVGNGHLATTVYSDTVYVNGLYNGPTGWTHRARIPSYNAIRLHVQGQPSEAVKRTYALDVESAVFEESIISPYVTVKQRTYAHQYYNRLLLTEILVTRQGDTDMAVVLTVKNNRGNDSIDISFKQPENYQRPEICPDGCSLMEGQTLIPETETSSLHHITVVWKNLPAKLRVEPGVSEARWLFAMSADQNRIAAEQTFDDALRQWTANHDYLYNMHVKAWEEKWNKGRIEVDDNPRLSKLIYGSFYYMLSFLPSTDTFVPNNQFYGLSPGGLANGANWTDYQGHVFWDMETWMYPTMLMFHPELAKEMLSYRIYSMPPSQKRAESGGYSGLRYPWEAAFTGGEVTPDICVPCRENQQHITGDIAFAARQYLTATRDIHWLKSEKGYEFIKGMAEFWKTRPEWNEKTGYYDINGVMPPDEHQLSINNSVYTNIGAKLSIHFARYAACLVGMKATEEISEDWLEVARKIFIPFDDERQYHPEFQGYGNVTGEKKIVKQADVILAGFPQMWPMPATVRQNDLEVYEMVTHPGGPAMTWGMFAIGWLELGNEEKAADTFHRSYSLYTREPFKIWTEARSGIGAVNFITGMGGFLQAVFFGYGGARLHVEKLDFDPRLVPGTSAMRFKGLNYLGNSLDVEIKQYSVQVICRLESRKHPLMLESLESGVRYHLKQDKELTFGREPFTVRAVDVTDCPLPEGGSCPEIIWRKTPTMVPKPKYKTVVVRQTGGNRCFDQSDCKSIVDHNQTYAGFHFLVGDDGRVYGGEGWDIPTDEALKIGFIGEFTCKKPSQLAIAAAKQLIKCKVEMGMLEYDYKLLTLRQTKDPDCQTAYCPGDRLDCVLITWKAWDKEQVGGKFQAPKCHGSCFLPDPTASSHSSQYTDISDQPTLFQTEQLPVDSKTGKIDFSYMASVSNGHLATVVFSDTIYVNGLYNEHMGWSHRARIPSPNAVRVDRIVEENPDRVKRLFTLDVEKAVFMETIETPNLLVVDRIYAHQTFTRVLITEITVTRKPSAKGSFMLKLTGNQGNASIDLEMLEERSYNGNDDSILFKHARTLVPEIRNMSTSDVYMVYTITPQELVLTENENTKTLFILTSVGMDISKVTENFDSVEGMVAASPKSIYETHVLAWREKWKRGHIEIDGNLKLSKLVYGCFYYLLSFLPSTQPFSPSQPFNGLSPGGLANGANWTDYQGHVFWDMETWMYPTMLMFHPELAKEMLSYRIRGMKYAYDRARSGGYEGLRFPWEAAQTGIEVTPDICVPCRENQLHITGDIAMAAKQFMSVTKDLHWLKSEKGYTLIKDIARFWKSRPTWNEAKQEYEIKGVMPPDEHAQNVSNSVYTNVQAQLSIYYARYMACINNLNARTEVTDDWLHVADNLHIPFDETRMFHPEYEGYVEGSDNRGVKQADVILLGFPLMYNVSEEVRRNDLLHYERVTNAFGPAMTWGMFSIGWLELGDIDKAAELFTKSYELYTREPFKIWTEARSGIGAVNFITGMGGFLQAVYFGYGGVRIYNEHMSFNPRLPPMTSGLRLLGMNYLGNSLDVVIRHNTVSITVTHSSQLEPLYLKVLSTQAVYDLQLDVEVVIKKEAFTIASYHVSDCPYPQDPVCPAVISRRDWSSSMMEDAEMLGHPVGNVIVYQTSSRNCYSRQSCGKEAKSQLNSEGHVKYNFLIGEDGSIFEGRGWKLAGDHSEDFNTKSIAIALLGNFTTAGPSKRGMSAVKLLIKCGMEIGKINETYSLMGEKQIRAGTCDTCPADRLLCELMKSHRWHNYQAGGSFKAPCCMEVCGEDKKTTPKPTSKPSSVSTPLFTRTHTLVILTALITGLLL
ncbi:uncharacterized protein LOC135482416 [Liolophura sinensis]|uniref:uncharacterized protein LOC135482416 n=1 Tax=Liolophura sinensis TaxID=3198878 RepID=UPI003158B712